MHWLVIVINSDEEIVSYWEEHELDKLQCVYKANQDVRASYKDCTFIVEPLAEKS